jgi:hypothetical protein
MHVPTVGAPSTVPPIFGSMRPSIVVLLLHLCDMPVLHVAFRILVWTVSDDTRDGGIWSPPNLGPLCNICALCVTGPILLYRVFNVILDVNMICLLINLL